MSDYNFQVYSPSRNVYCNHMHHSEKRARNCAEHLGWSDAAIVKVHRRTYRVKGGPQEDHYLPGAFDTLYDATISLTVRADSDTEAYDIIEKWSNNLTNARNYVRHEVTNVRKRIE